jgi:hypothetical protein
VPPSLFGTIVDHLGSARLVRDGRVAVEKPFGHDLGSARELDARLHRVLRDSIRVGTASTVKRACNLGASSTLTFTSFTCPARSRASCRRAGLILRQGGHHCAQMTTSTGIVAPSAISVKLSSSASTIQGRIRWHFRQRGNPAAAAGSRFRRPHFSHRTFRMGTSQVPP